jgi:hypothetical protein
MGKQKETRKNCKTWHVIIRGNESIYQDGQSMLTRMVEMRSAYKTLFEKCEGIIPLGELRRG